MRAAPIGLAMILCSFAVAPEARATLIASESFVCAQPFLANQGGGTGWFGNWITGQSQVFPLNPQSLGVNIGAVGGSLKYDGSKAVLNTGGRIFRQIDLGAN